MTKAKAIVSTNPKIGEDDSTSPKSYYRGESSNKTVARNSRNSDQPTEEIEPTKWTPRRSGLVRRPIEFSQLGLDYVNYTNTSESALMRKP